MEITDRDETAAHVALVSLTFAVLVRTAWISDSALETLHCAMNFIHGYGPRITVYDRAQPFIHPLWFLSISGVSLILRNAFAATFALSIVLSLATVWLLIARLSTSFRTGMLAGASLVLSKAYVDFSTSGLENPLSHFLLVIGLLLGFKCLEGHPERKDARRSAAEVGAPTVLLALYLCRPDLVLLVLPFWLAVLWKSYRGAPRTAATILIAIAPVAAWTLFSVYYYGAPLSSVAYAQMGGGVPRLQNIRQGIVYLADSLSRDPITLTFISVGVLLALRASTGLKMLAVGIVLYLAYVVGIGGNFMSGRFLTAPLLASAIVLSRSELTAPGIASVTILLAALGAISLPSTILADRTYSDRSITARTIRDERGFAFYRRGLASSGTTRDTFRLPDEWTPQAETATSQESSHR
jgi:arabinofuranosyltransferase